METAKFSPGFRFSFLDGVVLTLAGVVLLLTEWRINLVGGLLLGHFFLFCNVFRMSRKLELLWSAAFLLLAVATIQYGIPGWWATGLGSILVALLVLLLEMRKPSYHGVGWSLINPDLEHWWTTQKSVPPTNA